MGYWVAIGPVDNWEIGIKEKMWAIPGRYRNSWGRMQEGDTLFFYIRAPIKGLVGFGMIAKTEIGKIPFWPAEIATKIVMWPLRIRFGPVTVIHRREWEIRAVHLGRHNIAGLASLQRVDEEKAHEWIKLIERSA